MEQSIRYEIKLNPHQRSAIESIHKLNQACQVDQAHVDHVTQISLQLIDELFYLHGFGEKEFFLQQCSALLHDIGHSRDNKNHHKAALEIILESPILNLTPKERLIIGSVARYHKGSLPSLNNHSHYKALSDNEKHLVCVLGGILRLADGLETTLRTDLQNIKCRIDHSHIHIDCYLKHPSDQENNNLSLPKKTDLLEMVFHRKVILHLLVNDSEHSDSL